MGKVEITAERLRELFAYDADTGSFVRRVAAGYRGCRMAGTVASGVPNSNGYLRIGIDGNRYQAHRLAWLYVHGVWPAGEVDHINGDRTDNRISNLRVATRSLNAQNVRGAYISNRSASSLGVSFDKRRQRWRASIQVNGKWRQIGRFDSESEASAAYLAEKRLVHPGCTI